jgi:hypothetical protein
VLLLKDFSVMKLTLDYSLQLLDKETFEFSLRPIGSDVLLAPATRVG